VWSLQHSRVQGLPWRPEFLEDKDLVPKNRRYGSVVDPVEEKEQKKVRQVARVAESRTDLELEDDAMPASWNYLHWMSGSLRQIYFDETGGATFAEHMQAFLKEEGWSELADEKCCVTGKTPLLVLVSDCHYSAADFETHAIVPAMRRLVELGASRRATDNLGRGAVELYWRNNCDFSEPFELPDYLRDCPDFVPPAFAGFGGELGSFKVLPDSEVALLAERAKVDVSAAVVRLLFNRTLERVVPLLRVVTEHQWLRMLHERHVLQLLPQLLTNFAGRTY
jgi:hypothetical protein